MDVRDNHWSVLYIAILPFFEYYKTNWFNHIYSSTFLFHILYN